jgi:REP element-mobilizing transposase RayT
MARQLRVEYEGAIYHVTVRSNSGGDLFVDDGDREYWVYRVGESAAEHRVKILSYCLMANHFHLVAETPRGNLGRFMQSLLTGYTVYFNRRHRKHGHVTQGRYGARLVDGNEYLLKLSRYVHLNPVKVPSVREWPLAERLERLRNYVWSSYWTYIGQRRGPDWLSTGPMLALVAGQAAERGARYQEFVEAGVAEDDVEFQSELMRSARCIGGSDFREEVEARYHGLVRASRRPEDVALRWDEESCPVSAETVLETVAEAFGVTREELANRRRASPQKALAAFMLVRFGGLTQREIGPLLGLRSGSSVSCQVRRYRASFEREERLVRLIRRIERSLRKREGSKQVR